jgi:hypothetical protein
MKPPRPSVFETVDQVLGLVRSDKVDTSDNPCSVASRAAIPDRLPHTQRYMAWEVYYKNPNARRAALAALTTAPKARTR